MYHTLEELKKKENSEIPKNQNSKPINLNTIKSRGLSTQNKNINNNKKLDIFKGRGKRIGKISNTIGLKVNKKAIFKIDKNKPICKINIRLFNGEVICKEFNLTNTLKDIFNYVEKVSGSKNFSLLEGFPPKIIKQFDKSIEELKLQESTLTQKIN
jgi:Golgi nucleoside diphosphatase